MSADMEMEAGGSKPGKRKRGRPKGSGNKRRGRKPGRPKGSGRRGRPPAEYIRLALNDLIRFGSPSVTVKKGKLIVEIPLR